MKNSRTSFLDLIKGLVVLFILGAGFYFMLNFVLSVLLNLITEISKLTSKLDAVVMVALITGAVSITGVVLSSIVSKILEYRQKTMRYLYEKREEPYSAFIEILYKLLKNSREGKISNDDEIMKELINDTADFSKKLTLWGSNRVIRKWLKYRENVQQRQYDGTQHLLIWEEIIFEIRRDMGQKKRGLKQGDILAFIINDIDKILSSKNNSLR